MYLSKIYRKIKGLHSLIPYRLFPSGYAFPPLRVAIMVTHRCNLRCEMCMIVHQNDSRVFQGEMSTQEVMRVIDMIPRFSVITITGGEPFVKKDILKILRYATRNHRCHVITNGTLLRGEMIKEIMLLGSERAWGKGILMVGFSIQGIEEYHDRIVDIKGSFKKTIESIQQLQEEKRRNNKRYPLIDIKMVVSDSNAASLIDILELSERVEADFCSFQILNTQTSSYGIEMNSTEIPLRPPDPVRFENIDVLKGQLKEAVERAKNSRVEVRFNPSIPPQEFIKRYQNRLTLDDYICHAPWSEIHINPKGEVYPCCSISMGNILKDALKNTWNSNKFKEFRKRLKQNRIFPGCEGCCFLEG